MQAEREGLPREILPVKLNTNEGSILLMQKGVRVERGSKVVEIPYDDIIGYTEHKISAEEFELQINCFGKVKRLMRAERREISQIKIFVQAKTEQMQTLKDELLKAITNRPLAASRCLLIYFNPNAGSNSKKHLDAVLKFLTLTNFTHYLIQTTHRGHCKQHLSSIDPQAYAAAVIISGDGLMHQFANSKAATLLPVTHVPAGSANAFAKNQSSMAGEDCTDQTAIFLAVKGRTTHMNLIKMQLEKEPQPIYSFLSLEWAFLADIDMNSEFLRALGGFRFEVFSAYRCLALKRYSGKLTYSQTQNELPPLNEPIIQAGYITIETNFLNAIFCNIPFISDKYEFAPLLKVEDRAIDMQFTTEQQGRMELIKYLLASEKGDHFDRAKRCKKQGYNFGHAKVKSYRLEPQGSKQEQGLFGIDGEHYEAQRLQASISDKRLITFI